ncbi:Thioredoxin-like [Novymonas esmeraldas]|uniref:Thioredoxin-like n=1 Tax=Novymonas esmeraldas TaxID=1808958 RepID=A0AAW0EU64_9TRYP
MPFDLFHRDATYTLARQDGLSIGLRQALRTRRYVVVYIASQWWAPCRGVTAQLCAFYDKFHDACKFEVVFLSTDRSKEAMLNFFRSAHGDWLCLDYDDARRLEAELAGDADLHPKQVPACLVFELEPSEPGGTPGLGHAALDGGDHDGSWAVSPTTAVSVNYSTSSSSTPSLSFARLVTKFGREMLSKDKDAVLFPWRDDGWCDTASARPSPTPLVPPSPALQPSEDGLRFHKKLHRGGSSDGRGTGRASSVDAAVAAAPESVVAVATPTEEAAVHTKEPPREAAQHGRCGCDAAVAGTTPVTSTGAESATTTPVRPRVAMHRRPTRDSGTDAAAAETTASSTPPSPDGGGTARHLIMVRRRVAPTTAGSAEEATTTVMKPARGAARVDNAAPSELGQLQQCRAPEHAGQVEAVVGGTLLCELADAEMADGAMLSDTAAPMEMAAVADRGESLL